MDAGSNDPATATVAKAIGEELRRARDTLGWTRAELVDRLSFELHTQTLAGYERGSIQFTVRRFVEICGAMGVSAPDVLSCAMQRAEIDLPVNGVRVDLRAVVADKTAELLPLRRWARKRLESDHAGPEIARLEWAVIQEMATLFGFDRPKFVKCLITYTPRPVPQWR